MEMGPGYSAGPPRMPVVRQHFDIIAFSNRVNIAGDLYSPRFFSWATDNGIQERHLKTQGGRTLKRNQQTSIECSDMRLGCRLVAGRTADTYDGLADASDNLLELGNERADGLNWCPTEQGEAT